MTNVQGSREHIIQSRLSVPTEGYVGNLRDLINFYDQNGPVGRDYDDSARLENDGETISLVWEVKREPLPAFSELDNFLRFVVDVGITGKWTEEISEFMKPGEASPLPDPKTLSRYIKAYQHLVKEEMIKQL